MEPLTYRCNSCNSDISPTAGLLCPNCTSPLPSTNSNPNPNPPDQTPSPSPSFFNPLPPTTLSVTASDDNFLLDSPYLHRLIHHLTNSNHPTTTTTTTSRHHSPTSKSAIDAIPTITITPSFLDTDPIVLCAVCKDQFVIDDVTKQLPCKHMYHPDCILPWLVNRNSCPVCRFQMPKEADRGGVSVRRRSRSRILRLEDVDDEAMLGIGFRNLHHQTGGGEVNVSGWRSWPVNQVDSEDGENYVDVDVDVGMI